MVPLKEVKKLPERIDLALWGNPTQRHQTQTCCDDLLQKAQALTRLPAMNASWHQGVPAKPVPALPSTSGLQ